MEEISNLDMLESIKSMQSTVNKLENAFTQMTQSGANTTMVKKRLQAVCVGLAILEEAWNQKPHPYNQADIVEARKVLISLIPSVENSYTKSKAGSPQRTLLERRLKALKLVVQAIDDLNEE